MSRLNAPPRAAMDQFFDTVGLQLIEERGRSRTYCLARQDGRGSPINGRTLAIVWNLWEMEAEELLRNAASAQRVFAAMNKSPKCKKEVADWLMDTDQPMPPVLQGSEPAAETRKMPRGWRNRMTQLMSIPPDNDLMLVPSVAAILRASD